ncbi:MAG TPA: cell division protein FtsA [Candidatus Dormibacteraeota bacterium]|nr:cell division protein FtsA [Candidatus Dormibacteraeota bacterium]
MAALDLGTTKVCCAVADVEADGMRILGVGEVQGRGVRKGMIVDIDRAAEGVAEALDAAERQAGVPISGAVVGIAGSHIGSQNSRGLVAVTAGRREVRQDDVGRAVDAARSISIPSDREIVHVLPRSFTVDGQDGVRDALGMHGTRLGVETHIVTGASTAIQNVVKVMHEAGLDVDDLVLQALASAEAVVTEEEFERGVVVADIGGGTMDIAVFSGGSIAHSAVVPIGGNHVTGDLAVGLRADLETAEEVKRRVGHCLQLTVPADATVTITPMGYDEPAVVPQRYVAEVIGPRAREMAELILTEIQRAGGSPASLPGGVVLTGGGSLLRGFAEITAQVVDLPVRVASPQPPGVGLDEALGGPQHATCVGLLRWASRQRPGRAVRHSNGNGAGRPTGNGGGPGSVNERFGRWLRELF